MKKKTLTLLSSPTSPKKKKKSTSFSTGPGSRPTHWKQTVLYLDEPVVLCAGEKMQASLRCAPNAGNPRDLDIELEYRSGGSRGAVGPRQQSFRMR
jgi:protein arginine N-methyltransferase 1